MAHPLKASIYQDYCNNNQLLFSALAASGWAVDWIDADEILAGRLSPDVDLFVMPGGEDLYYCERLNGAGNAAIRRYVEAGGCYLGICAGAYYGCEELTWEAGQPMAICGPRELAFFPGCATGPIYEFLEDGDINKTWDYPARIGFEDGDEAFEGLAVYSGGPIFTLSPAAAPPENIQILGRYLDLPNQPAAIVKCTVGQGHAILTGLHGEWDAERYKKRLYQHKANTFARKQAVLETLENQATAQARLWAALLRHCVG